MESLAYDYASHGTFDNKFSNTSNHSFFWSSVQLKSLDKCNITIDVEFFDINNVAPESLYLDKEDKHWLCSLFELECENILAKCMEMLCNEHLMRKAIQKASSTMLDNKLSKGTAPVDCETNQFSKVVFPSSQSKVLNISVCPQLHM